MEVLTGAMTTLLPKLGDLLTEEYKLQKSVRGEIMFLEAELKSMEAALLKVSEVPIDEPPDIQVKLWAKEVRELSYDIEDRVDTFMVRIDGHAPRKLHGLKGFIDRSVNLLTKANIYHNIDTDIKDLKCRIKEVNERRDRYKVDNVAAKPTGPSVDSLRLSALYRKAAELIGTEEKSNYLVKRLMDGYNASKQQGLKTVSIVGFGGLGKTTLAKLVYDKLKVHFDCWAFVSVSLNPNMINLFKNMLHQLGNYKNVATWDEAQLIDELREFLRNKRYFIVIDDIWSKSAWNTIQYALIENECGSRIITTTRILDVAKSAGGVYELQRLTPADSRKLFNIRIFGTEEKCLPNNLAEVYKNILKKCGGVPLAIITIASMLASKKGNENTLKYWSKVYQTMGSGLEDSPDISDMRRILFISYYDLPPHLKTCLLYLSLFSEDSEISTEYLIWQWVGEGFVLKEQGKAMYEVGEDYVDQLINRSMIEAADIDHDSNKVTYCRIHDMVLDLVTCLSNEDGFQTALDGQRPMYLSNRIRRLSLQTTNEEDVKQLATMSLSHMRSLTVFKGAFNLLPALSTFPVLRVLDLSGCRQVDNHHFKDICNLFHLRFLGLWFTSITEIPEEIGNLKFLEVLDISCTEVEELPSTFVQLQKLVCLRFDYLKRVPNGLFGDLKSLEQLEGRIDVESPTMLCDLGSLTKLRRVALSFNEWNEIYKKPFLQCLSNLVSLEYLKIHGYNGDFGSKCDILSPRLQQLRDIRIMGCTIPAVPRWMSSLSALSILCMTLLRLGEEDLHVLGSIPSLSHLEIMVKEPTQDRDKRLVISNVYPFLCLTKFKIYNTTEVVFLQRAMQKLQTLVLSFGVPKTKDQFDNFDFGLENLSSLMHITVDMNCEDNIKAAIKKAVDMNPNKPTLKFQTL
ncbi:disease resistance protein PIK6-NP-like isoform X2 [Phragmites australis]|nr:disease resistance protein PIK6-NP-like isoform X2 [Phragmites australis]